MDDLVTWLRGVLAETERLTRAANQAYRYAPGAVPPDGGVHWRWVDGEQWETVDLDAAEEFVSEAGHPSWLATVEEWQTSYDRTMPRSYVESAVEVDIHAARLIALHDPAAVLADIAAKRAILDLHGGLSACPVCISDREGRYPEDWRNDQTPCQTVRLLAEPFADHLDYQATWRPQ